MNHLPSDTSANKHVLIIEGAGGTFSKYTAEILKAEGLNLFQTRPLDNLCSSLLKGFWVVILNETALEEDQAQTIREYVSQGGCLIAFRPDPQLSDIFGITPAHEEIGAGYLRIDTDTQIGVGLTAETIQVHAAADAYNLAGGNPAANLYRSPLERTEYPAVVHHTFGKGHAVAFTYNLPQSIVYTRQGNPAWAGQERDGILGIRAAEMYLGWNDPTNNHLNQADEHMRLLSNSIETLSSETSPLPRLWYFPGFHRSLVILTDDGEDSSEEDFETHLTDIESAGGHLTLYLKGTYIPPKTVARWTARGHEIGSHFDDTAEAEHPTYAGMNAVAQNSVQDHRDAYHISPVSIRNHWIVWVGWSEQAEIEANCGIRMDCNTYHYDLGSPDGHYLGKPGNFTGSGLPMKFASQDGAILDIYQSITQLPDEQWLEPALLTSFKTLIDRSLDEEAYTYINVNFHTDRWQPWSRKPGMEMLDYAKRRSVPLWNAANAIDFLTARDAASFENLCWMEGNLSFDLYTPNPNQSLTFMLPQSFAKQVLFRVTINGVAQSWLERTIKSRAVVLVPVDGSGPFHITGSYR